MLTLPAVDYRVFVLAARILRRVMGRKAPTVLGLIQHTLTERSSTSVADDYLEWVGWPVGRVAVATLPTARRSRAATSLKLPPLRTDRSLDPTRN